jgi:hypothetical protein
MSITTGWKFTNNTASSQKTFGLLDLGLSNYSTPQQYSNGTEVRYDNNTDGSSFTSEILRYRCAAQKGTPDSVLVIEHPTKATSKVVWGVTCEAQAVTESSDDPTYEVDNACTCKIVFTNMRDRNITASLMEQLLRRAVSSLYRSSDGSFIGADLMQGSIAVSDI